MSTHGMEPEGEALTRAVKWIGQRRLAQPDAHLADLLDEAGRQFDLTPREQEFLQALLAPEHGPA